MTELGARLKEARLAKGYSIDDLQEITKIQKRYLASIEEGNYATMPGSFYVRAFIKQYAEAVGLNGDELLETYRSEVPSPSNEEVTKNIPVTPSRRTLGRRSSGRFMEIFPMVIVALFIIAIIVIVWTLRQSAPQDDSDVVENDPALTYQTNNPPPSSTPVEKEQPTEEDTVDPDESAEEEEEPVQEQAMTLVNTEGVTTTYQITGAEAYQLKVDAKDRTWLTLRDQAGNSLYDAAVEAGSSYELDVSQYTEITVRVGYVPGSSVYINDELVEFPTERTPQNLVIQFNK